MLKFLNFIPKRTRFLGVNIACKCKGKSREDGEFKKYSSSHTEWCFQSEDTYFIGTLTCWGTLT